MTKIWTMAVVFAFAFGHVAVAQDAAEVRLAKQVFQRLQPMSFKKQREYCGYIGFNDKGVLVATEAVAGTMASCGAPLPTDIAVTASYHTHGAFDQGYFNEVPSDIDMKSDQQFYMNGYVATPGGRMWFIDSQTMVATLICGVACLPVAPGFYKGADGDIAVEYSFDALVLKLGQ